MKKQISTEDGKKRRLEQQYMQLQMIAEHIKTMQQQLGALTSQIDELEQTREALKEFATVRAGSEILVPLAGGIFAKATITDTRDLIVNIGGRVAATKTIPELDTMLGEQITEIRNAETQLTKQLEAAATQAGTIESELNAAAP
ncbi:prefoldin subunit alpha [Candidatus Woesearchaeota archaeon]|nr:prefoldin subunit alpha [Candidatus Woesearchaeota archaeon]